MTALDIVIIIFCGVGLVTGLCKGCIRQLGSIAAIVLGVVACRLWGDAATDIVAGWLDAPADDGGWSCRAAAVLGNVALFLVVYILTVVVAKVLHQMSHTLMLGPLDHVAGGLLGMFKWIFLLSVLINMWLVLNPLSDIVEASTLAGGGVAGWVTGLAPGLLGAAM